MLTRLRAGIPLPVRQLKCRVLGFVPGPVGAHHRTRLRYLNGIGIVSAFGEALLRQRGKTHIDLGANVGEFTAQMAATGDRVIAFEPDPWTFDVLRAETAHLPNVELVNAAAGTSDGTLTMYRSRGYEADPKAKSQGTTAFAARSDADTGSEIRVPQVDFARFLSEIPGPIGMVKIDIEGAEVDLLEALLASPDFARIGAIFVETHERLIPEHAPRIERLIRATRRWRLMLRLRRVAVPYVTLDWH